MSMVEAWNGHKSQANVQTRRACASHAFAFYTIPKYRFVKIFSNVNRSFCGQRSSTQLYVQPLVKMNRRNPTRIELKLDDLQEYDLAKKEFDEKNKAKDGAVNADQSSSASSGQPPPPPTKSKQALVQERIGFRMQSQSQSWKRY